jgi:hypothetical protein
MTLEMRRTRRGGWSAGACRPAPAWASPSAAGRARGAKDGTAPGRWASKRHGTTFAARARHGAAHCGVRGYGSGGLRRCAPRHFAHHAWSCAHHAGKRSCVARAARARRRGGGRPSQGVRRAAGRAAAATGAPEGLKVPITSLISTTLVDRVSFWQAPCQPRAILAWERAHLPARFDGHRPSARAANDCHSDAIPADPHSYRDRDRHRLRWHPAGSRPGRRVHAGTRHTRARRGGADHVASAVSAQSGSSQGRPASQRQAFWVVSWRRR